jgi:Tfp pilus assembly PilM family ATPase
MAKLRFPFKKARKTRPSGPVTAIEWEGTQLRIVRGEPAGENARITSVFVSNLELSAEEKNDPAILGRGIAKAIKEARISPGGDVVMAIPRGQVVLRTLSLPGVGDIEALASMVHFQIAKDLPFRADEAVIDFRVRGPSPASSVDPANPSQEVLVAAVRRSLVEFYAAVAEAAGLRLSSLGLLSYANARCLEACKAADPAQTLALVSVRAEEIGVDVISNRTLLFSRNALVKLYGEDEEPPHEPLLAPEAGETAAVPNEKPTSFEELASIEVVRTLHGYAGVQGNNPVTQIIVTGVTGLETAITKLVAGKISIPVSVLDIGQALELPNEFRPNASGAIGPIGLVIGTLDLEGLPFNFLNPKKPAVQRDYRRLKQLAVAAAILLVGVLTFTIRAQLIKRRQATQAELRMQLEALEKLRPTFKKMIQQAKVIDDWSKSGKDWLAHYAYLSQIMPPSDEVYITSLAVSGNGTIRLGVQARSGETLAKLEKQLRAAQYEIKPIAITPTSDRFGYDFRSTVELAVPEKLKIDLSKGKAPPRPADDASMDPVVFRKGGRG